MDFLRKRDGFTLVEVLVASAVLLIAVLALSALLLHGYRMMNSAGKRSTALHQAQGEMEDAINDPDYEPEYEDVVISRVNDEVILFGERVSGTLVTVRRTYTGQPGGEITYTYFDADEEP